MDLLQFGHQINFGMQTPRRIKDDHIGLTGVGRRNTVKGHGPRIGPRLVTNKIGPGPFGPDRQLVNGGCPKGIPATNRQDLPASRYWAVNFAMEVVLPTPLTPTTRTAKGESESKTAGGGTDSSSVVIGWR